MRRRSSMIGSYATRHPGPMLLDSLAAARGYEHLYIAPHLDDAALSCGGQIAQLVDRGARVLIVTLCAGNPPRDAPLTPFAQYLHGEWALGDAPMSHRRAEDQHALEILGCDGLQLDQLDAPYRVPRYGVGDGWRGAVDPADPLIPVSLSILTQLHEQQPESRIYVPLGVGNHVDHQIACAGGMQLHAGGAAVVWYEDAPYAAKDPESIARRLTALPESFHPEVIDITNGMHRKLQAIAAYESQRSELFGDADMTQVMTGYAAEIAGRNGYGERMWRAER